MLWVLIMAGVMICLGLALCCVFYTMKKNRKRAAAAANGDKEPLMGEDDDGRPRGTHASPETTRERAEKYADIKDLMGEIGEDLESPVVDADAVAEDKTQVKEGNPFSSSSPSFAKRGKAVITGKELVPMSPAGIAMKKLLAGGKGMTDKEKEMEKRNRDLREQNQDKELGQQQKRLHLAWDEEDRQHRKQRGLLLRSEEVNERLLTRRERITQLQNTAQNPPAVTSTFSPGTGGENRRGARVARVAIQHPPQWSILQQRALTQGSNTAMPHRSRHKSEGLIKDAVDAASASPLGTRAYRDVAAKASPPLPFNSAPSSGLPAPVHRSPENGFKRSYSASSGALPPPLIEQPVDV